ncbi:hypothetical protein AAFF39_05315 [Lactococcus garvieae]
MSSYGTGYLSILPIGKSSGILTNNHIGEMVQTFNFPIELKFKGQFPDMNSSFGYKSKMSQGLVRSKVIHKETVRNGNVQHDQVRIGQMGLQDMAKRYKQKFRLLNMGAFYLFLLQVALN